MKTPLPLLACVLLSACGAKVAQDERADDDVDVASSEVRVHWKGMEKAPIAGRSAHAAVWTGSSMLVGLGLGDEGYLGDAATYDPQSDAWTKVASPLSARQMPLAVHVPGGAFVGFGAGPESRPRDASIFDDDTRTWKRTPRPPIAGRTAAAIVAVDDTVVIWGGETDDGFVDDGARFDVSSRTWTKIAAAPLSARAFVTTVKADDWMIVYGGIDRHGKILGDAAAYDVKHDVWQRLDVPSSIAPRAAASSAKQFVFGGRAAADREDGCPQVRDDGVFLDGATIAAIPAAPIAPRADAATWSARGSLYVFGGFVCEHVYGDGARFDGTRWTSLPSGGPSPRRGVTAVVAGRQAMIWGGTDETGSALGDGMRFVW